jgi:phosphatidylglycerophosphate synthase
MTTAPTLQEIRSVAQKPTNFWWPIYYFFSSFIVWIAARARWTPNGITVVAFCINSLGALFFMSSRITAVTILIGYLIFNIAHVFDFVDGQLATVTHQRSKKGAWFDSTFDILKIALVTACFTKLLYELYDESGYISRFILALAVMGNICNYTVSLAANAYRQTVDPYGHDGTPLSHTLANYGLHSRLAGFLLSCLREYGNFLLIFAIFAYSPRIGVTLLCFWGALQWGFAINRIRSVGNAIS